jgi:hypothetical protein
MTQAVSHSRREVFMIALAIVVIVTLATLLTVLVPIESPLSFDITNNPMDRLWAW